MPAEGISIGFGDRLGIATPGQLEAIENTSVFPVLAQQSMRELSLLGRTYEQVIAAAGYGVFEQGWKNGWGADGDHLKTAEEVLYALDCGMTMITLDCTEQIQQEVIQMDGELLEINYQDLPKEVRNEWEELPLSAQFNGVAFNATEEERKRAAVVYGKIIPHVLEINHIIQENGSEIDLELSVDETDVPTTPYAHFCIASLLQKHQVVLNSLAPRFPGEFQKGIDYMGDPEELQDALKLHMLIAKHFGYKISVHSGSDKYTAFPIIAEQLNGNYHLKTAGTSWLEALKVIAEKDSNLFKEIYQFALKMMPETTRYYHISADPGRIMSIEKIEKNRYPQLLNHPDARQILHIAYGVLFRAVSETGKPLFQEKIMLLLKQNEERYNQLLKEHFQEHLHQLKIL